MYKICVFAGTTEGRRLVEFLSSQQIMVTACVATEYGETLLPPADNLTVSAKRLTKDEMTQLFSDTRFSLVIDATHPYADEVTEHIEYACKITDTKYMRLLRGESSVSSDAVFVPDISAAVDYLNRAEGNILLTTGSKELSKYTAICDFSERVYVRILPAEESFRACLESGVNPDHIMAMQGPFSEEMNTAMLKAVSAKYLVTKDGGVAGGFDAKAAATQKTDTKLIVIGRPPQKDGVSYSEVIDKLCTEFGCLYKPCVKVVGIGPGGRNAMTHEVSHAIRYADCIIGAKRMLESVECACHNTYEAVSPEKIAEYITAHSEYQNFTVVMSGDTGFFSGTKKLLPMLADCDVKVLPGINSLSYLCAKLKVAYEDIRIVSMHGRECDIVSEVRANPWIFVLTGGSNGAGELCKVLADNGMENVKVYIGERLSYADEKITAGTATELCGGYYDALSVVLIENNHPEAVITHGLPDDAFSRSMDADIIPMTKSEVRSVCLSKLGLTKYAACWDIGAGTGSVSVEMALQAEKGHVYAIEQKKAAAELINQNKERFGLNNMTVINGKAPEICADLPAPTHAFIGGSCGNMRNIIELLLEKKPSVRIVATAVSLETIAELTSCMKDFDFTETEVISMNISRDNNVGQYHMMSANNPVYIFTMQNGGTKL